MPSQPSRRALLMGSVVGVLSLGGCGLRLEDDAPQTIPFVPGREKIPGESALLAVLGYLESKQDRTWRRRADTLREALSEAHVPERLLEDVPAPKSTADIITALEGSVRDCGPGLLPLVGALTAAQIMETPELFSDPSTRAWQAGKVAAADLKATRAATYALEVIAAKGSEKVSDRAGRTRSSLRDLTVRQTTAAGKHAGSLTLGYDLDTRVPSSAAAEELALQSLVRLVGAYSDGLAKLGKDRAAALETAHWMATAQGLAEDWGASRPVVIGAAEA